jgi:hypothetical protein
MLVIYACTLTASMLTMIVVAIWAFSGTEAVREHGLLYVYFGILIILPLEMINFVKQHKHCGRYSYDVSQKEIIIRDAAENRVAHVAHDDIEQYQLVDIGYSVYTAIRIYMKGGQRIVMYRTMKNYGRLKRQLKAGHIPTTRYCDVRIGTYEDNVL